MIQLRGNLIWFAFFSLQGNITAIKYINKKRIELTRTVLFELKHVSVPVLPPSAVGLLP